MSMSIEAAMNPFTVPDPFGVDFFDRGSESDIERVLKDEITKRRARDVMISLEGHSHPLFI